jgi:hypothetical protein
MKLVRLITILFLLHSRAGFAQDSTQSDTGDIPSGIRVSARLIAQQIPLNRTLAFIIQVEWFGDLNRYEISEVENPSVKNFTVIANSSSDRRQMVAGKMTAIKTFEYELQPQELGMGYVDGVIVKYIDKETGEGKHLLTNRLEAKVIDPLPEPGDKTKLLVIIFTAIILIGSLALIIAWLQRRRQQRQNVPPPPVPLEETYLSELKTSIALNSPDVNIKDGFAHLSRILRHYLAEKYSFPAGNALMNEIVATLRQKATSERLIQTTEEVLAACDIIKFSGGDGEKAELTRMFTLVEAIFQDELKTVKTGAEQTAK